MFIAKVLLEDFYGTHSNASVCLAESDAISSATTSTSVPCTHDPGLQPTKPSMCPYRILQHKRGVLRFTAAHTLKRTPYIPTLGISCPEPGFPGKTPLSLFTAGPLLQSILLAPHQRTACGLGDGPANLHSTTATAATSAVSGTPTKAICMPPKTSASTAHL